MISKMLRTPLITSAILLLVVTAIVYLTAASPEGSIFGAIGTLFVAIFRFVQLSVGLVIALLFCLAVLVGIFLGGMALVSRESAGKMTEKLRRELSDKLLLVRSIVIREDSSVAAAGNESRDYPKEEMFAAIEGAVDMIREDQTVADRNIEWLLDRVERLENNEELGQLALRQADLEQRLDEFAAGRREVLEEIKKLQGTVDEMGRQAGENAAQPVEELNERIEELADRVNDLDTNFNSLQAEFSTLKEGVARAELEEGSDIREEEHRLFAYVNNRSMQEKIEQLVTETLETDMSYAQVIEHLVKNTGRKTGEIIEAHPSLTEDYIRYRRNNG